MSSDGYEYPADLVEQVREDRNASIFMMRAGSIVRLADAAHHEHEARIEAEALLEEALDYMERHLTGDTSAATDMAPMLDQCRKGWRDGGDA